MLGGDSDTIHFYASRAFEEGGEDQETYFKWYKETKVFEDICDLEIDAITSLSADLDEIIPTVDGIIYFLNPLIQEESELFEMILPDIFSVKHDIPTIVIFYDQNGILPVSVNDLLQHIWVNFPSLEAFVNLSPGEFHQALQSLCLAMINGDTPLNIENAWMRFPIFIQMANIYFNAQNYYYAAQAIRKAALIADIYNKEEYFIISEQAAYLYSKINLYLEASKILEKIDKWKSLNLKKLYANAIIREGNLFFNRNEYEQAARNYERAAHWSSIELLEKKFIHESFRLAINSWISACRVEDAFRILQSLPHQGVVVVLKEVVDKIGAAADYLVKINNFESAREQLYRAVNRYQREDLFDELKDLTKKLTEVLIKLFKQQVDEQKKHAAKNTYDELENMWDSYKVKKENLDSTLEELINQFFESNNYRMATILIDKLNSRKLKQQLAKIRDEFEDRYEATIKKELEDYINKGIEIVMDFASAEQNIIIEMNTQKINEANELAKQNMHSKGAKLLTTQAEYLKKIGKEDIRDQILTKSLDLSLDGLIFEDFFEIYNKLSHNMKTKYLIRIFPIYLQKLKELKESAEYIKCEKILENSSRIYRNQMLYEESSEISIIFIKMIKREALRILESEENLSTINKALELVKKVSNITSAYLEKEEKIKFTFNRIFKKIAEIYIDLDDLHSAHTYNDRIEKKIYKTEIHKKIAKLEAEKSKIRTRKAIETREGEELKEKRSIIENKAREALLDKDNELKERKGLKRAYFKEGLTYLQNQEYDKAFELYKTSTNRLNRIKKFNLAGIALMVASLILMKENKFEDIKELLNETKKGLAGLGKLFTETFAITLLEYIVGLKSIQDEQKFKDSLNFLESLPLFEEELMLLNDCIGEVHKKEEKPEPIIVEGISQEGEIKERLSRKEYGEYSKLLIEFDQRYAKIESKKGDIRRYTEDLFKKRKAMRKRIYSDIIELLESQKYGEAANKYVELAYILSKRKDLETSSLMVLMHGLALLKAGVSLSKIKNNVNDFLNSLGVNKKLVEETFYVMLIMFLIDVKLYNFEKFLPKIKEMFEILPLFEEEKFLTEIEE
jgi:TPR repeat protein